MSDTEKVMRELIEKFKIVINRSEMGREAIKGYNKCKDNDQAFITHKKGELFPRKYIDPHSVIMERQEHIDLLERQIKRIEEQEDYRNDIYTYAYKTHISPRMVSNSPSAMASKLNLQKMNESQDAMKLGTVATDASV